MARHERAMNPTQTRRPSVRCCVSDFLTVRRQSSQITVSVALVMVMVYGLSLSSCFATSCQNCECSFASSSMPTSRSP